MLHAFSGREARDDEPRASASGKRPVMGNLEVFAFPRRGKRKSIAVRHLDLRQTLRVHDFVFLDHVVFIQDERRERVDLVGCERPFLPHEISVLSDEP
jgi:hypothetical protein